MDCVHYTSSKEIRFFQPRQQVEGISNLRMSGAICVSARYGKERMDGEGSCVAKKLSEV